MFKIHIEIQSVEEFEAFCALMRGEALDAERIKKLRAATGVLAGSAASLETAAAGVPGVPPA